MVNGLGLGHVFVYQVHSFIETGATFGWFLFFFFNDPAPPELYPFPHPAPFPISPLPPRAPSGDPAIPGWGWIPAAPAGGPWSSGPPEPPASPTSRPPSP